MHLFKISNRNRPTDIVLSVIIAMYVLELDRWRCEYCLVIYIVVYQNTLEAAENLIKAHEAFITTTDANDEKINAVLQFANRLIEDQHYAADKVHKKAENISERYVKSSIGSLCWLVFDARIISGILICYITVFRRDVNRQRAYEQLERLKDQLLLQQFLQECDEV